MRAIDLGVERWPRSSVSRSSGVPRREKAGKHRTGADAGYCRHQREPRLV